MSENKPPIPTPPGFREHKPADGKPRPVSEAAKPGDKPAADLPKEVGGPPGPEPTRYGDWAFKGRVSDF